MKDWKIGTRIAAGFTAVLLVSLLFGMFTMHQAQQVEKKSEMLATNYFPSVLALTRIQSRLQESVSSLLQMVASSDAAEIEQRRAAISSLRAADEVDLKFYQSTPFTPEEAAIFADSEATRSRFIAAFAEVQRVGQSTSAAENVRAQVIFEQQLRPLYESYSAQLQSMVDLNKRGAEDGLASIREAVSSTVHGVLMGLLLTVAMIIPITFFIVRSISVPLSHAVLVLEQMSDGDLTVSLEIDTKDEVGKMAAALNAALEKMRHTLFEVAESAAHSNASSLELAAAAHQIASGAQQQAASLEQTSASLEQITAAVRQSADNAQQASQLAAGSRASAEEGQGVVTLAITAMADIHTSSSKIADIISTINEIAFQTNLLAVNAAVEAARAGEEGRGFAVVAAEVRSLAQRSAEAAKEIKTLILDSVGRVEKGTELVNRSGATLQGIVGSVKRVTDIVGEMAAASGEQSTGIEQVNTAVTQMDQVTQSNSAQTEELASTAQSFAEQAAKLLQLVSTFKLHRDGQAPAELQSQPARASAVRTTAVRSAKPARPGSGAWPGASTRPGGSFAGASRYSSRPERSLEQVAVPAGGGGRILAADLSSDDSFEEF